MKITRKHRRKALFSDNLLFLKGNILFSLEILIYFDKGSSFASLSFLREGSKSNFFRVISTKVYLFNSV